MSGSYKYRYIPDESLGEHSLGKVEPSLSTFGRNGLTWAYLGHKHERSACCTQEMVDVVLPKTMGTYL